MSLDLVDLNARLAPLSVIERLRLIAASASGRTVFTTSLGLEDQALTHLIVKSGIAADIVTLDTGRLFAQTYTLWRETEERYVRRIRAMYPDTTTLEELVADQGIDGFYLSPDARKRCCGVRKLAPLARALDGAAVWITGLRADQSDARAQTSFVEHNDARGLIKVSPLADWSREQLVAFVKAESIPYNPLHDKGFASIGCAPCTRALEPGEPERAGRWWWEQNGARECGLHVNTDNTAPQSIATSGLTAQRDPALVTI
jgi:phosphoadenosine phosphosulfate reductase